MKTAPVPKIVKSSNFFGFRGGLDPLRFRGGLPTPVCKKRYLPVFSISAKERWGHTPLLSVIRSTCRLKIGFCRPICHDGHVELVKTKQIHQVAAPTAKEVPADDLSIEAVQKLPQYGKKQVAAVRQDLFRLFFEIISGNEFEKL